MYDQFKFAARSSEGGLSFPYETKIHIMEHYDNEEMADTVYKPVYEYFNQINLGLLERREADIGVMKDLYMANVVVMNIYHLIDIINLEKLLMNL